MAKTIAYVAAIAAFFLAQTGAGLAQQPVNPAPNSPPLTIGSGDLVEITMFDDPELSGHFRVDEKGDITLPLLGRVRVEGATAEEAGTIVEERYVKAEILEPAHSHATVFISEYATQGITVTGEVKLPGVYPALGVRLLNDVITSAGGILPSAASKLIITRRSDPGNPVTVGYNPAALVPEIPRVQLFPGDTIAIPRAGIVYVLGDVNHSGGFNLEGRAALTVEEAMALAGGGGHAAALNRVHLVRAVEGGRKEDIVLAVNLIEKGRAPDVALKDGDILYIPTSTGKIAIEQAISSALGITTQVVTYRSANQ
ncbi:MAG: polysaccharide biosynthesis/export family protein [Terracidiphilus sp.]|jgi:polysaccharide export outer membrane protein